MLLSKADRLKLIKKAQPKSYGPKTPAQLRLNQLRRETKKVVDYRSAKPAGDTRVQFIGKNPATKEFHVRSAVPKGREAEAVLKFPPAGIFAEAKRNRLNQRIIREQRLDT